MLCVQQHPNRATREPQLAPLWLPQGVWRNQINLCLITLFISHHIALYLVGLVARFIESAVLWVIPGVVDNHDASYD